MIKIKWGELLNSPVHSSIFIVDFSLLMFFRPPAIASFLLLGLLVYTSVYLGLKYARLSENKTVA